MSKQAKNNDHLLWECKDCHRLIAEQETVAYHLVDRILYGWCESCFGQRSYSSKSVELAA
ncbi:MAG TPA: hypothetical protein VJZ26_19435 [Blastocatellia bacterium]|nr:hypothetical protein [Blastocatellia bacterium]